MKIKCYLYLFFLLLIYTIFHFLFITVMRFKGTFRFWNKSSKGLRQKSLILRDFQALFMESSFYHHIFSFKIRMNETRLLVRFFQMSFGSSHSLDMHIFIKKGKHFCKQNLHSSYIKSALYWEYISKRAQLNCWCLLCRRIRQDSRCAFLTTMNHRNTRSYLNSWRPETRSAV